MSFAATLPSLASGSRPFDLTNSLTDRRALGGSWVETMHCWASRQRYAIEVVGSLAVISLGKTRLR